MSLRAMLGMILAGCLIYWATSSPRATAEEKPYTPPPLPAPLIAIVDIEQVFQKDGRYQQGLQQLKADYEKAKAADLQELTNGEQSLANAKSNLRESDYRAMQGNFITLKHKLQGHLELLKTDHEFQRKQLDRQLDEIIREFSKTIAERNKIGLVLNHYTLPADDADEATLKRSRHQTVIYHQPGLDITGLVLGLLEQKHGVPQYKKEEPYIFNGPGIGLGR